MVNYAILTWLVPYIGAVLALVFSKLERVRDVIAALALFISALLSTIVLQEVISSSEGVIHVSYPWISTFGVTFGVYVDSLAAFMAFIVAWLSFLIGVYSLKYMEGDPGLTRYWFFFDFFVGSMLLLVLADNLILMFMGWEGTGLASYALIGHWYTDKDEKCVGDVGRKALGVPMWFSPSHSGLRAIVFTRLGDVGFIAAIGAIYYFTGTLSIPALAENVAGWAGPLAKAGVLFPFLLVFSLGAMAKSAQFPFHEWLVTAMTGPTPVSALIHAATMVKAGVYFLLRFSPIFMLAAHSVPGAAPQVHAYFSAIALIGGFTAFFMATQALVARELKLILAFSTASQLGYMFLALGSAGLIAEFPMGFLAGFSHLMSHAIFKASLFLAAGAIIHAVESKYIDDMGGLSSFMKATFLAMSIAALSLAGVPPLMGFWSKDTIIEVAKESEMFLPFFFGVVTAALTAFYSTRMVVRTFLYEKSHNVEHLEKEHELHEAHPLMLVPYLVLALISLIGGLVWPIYGPELLSEMVKSVLGIEEVFHPEIHLDIGLLATSLVMVFLGIGIAWILYQTGSGRSAVISITENPVGKALYNFLYDRWYLNSIYYIVIVGGFAALSRGIFKYFDSLIVDGFYHKFIPWITERFSTLGFKYFETEVIDDTYHDRVVRMFKAFGSAVRKVQTGLVNQYLVMFFLGLMLILLYLLWVG
ncbi:MAG: NADH-quinone oxidoreductase subunit L [Candidatus Korarchaeota archaeon]|nr:NADH-quinone oxidoreductase subunit L [Candidatus Korarchaeota archaeon]